MQFTFWNLNRYFCDDNIPVTGNPGLIVSYKLLIVCFIINTAMKETMESQNCKTNFVHKCRTLDRKLLAMGNIILKKKNCPNHILQMLKTIPILSEVFRVSLLLTNLISILQLIKRGADVGFHRLNRYMNMMKI